VLRGIRRTIGTARAGKAPATADLLMQMVALCPDSMIGRRDRALLALGFAGAFRRSELCALKVDDLVEVPDGLRVVIRRSKTKQTGEGQEVAIPRGYKLRSFEAVQAWLAAAEINSGPVFRVVSKGAKVSDIALADDSASRVVRRYAHRGRPGGRVLLGPRLAQRLPDRRSLERGQRVQNGGGQQTSQPRHAARYVRRVDLFKEHAGGGVPVMDRFTTHMHRIDTAYAQR
jgi:site-specific recombinase XerC